MSRMIKDSKSIGKLSTRKVSLFDHQNNKKISAVLPPMSVKIGRSRISHSALLAQGKEDPLPYIKIGFKPLRTKAKSAINPEQQQIFYVDGSKKKIGHCIAVQMSSPRHSQAGKFYNPSLILSSPGKIRHQNSSEISTKPPLSTTIQNFKNFLQHKYVQEIQEKRKGISIIEYDRKYGDSVSSVGKFNEPRYRPQEQINLICSEFYEKSVYLSTSFLKNNEFWLRDEGISYVLCHKDEIETDLSHCQSSQVNNLLQESTSSHITVQINSLTSVSKLKQILIEEDNNLHLSFSIPSYLKQPLKSLTCQQQIHSAVQQIFQEMAQFKPQLVSFKKFGNCILLVANAPQYPQQSYSLLWFYTGNFYFGGWRSSKTDLGCKIGIGLQYKVNQCLYFGEFSNNLRHGYGALLKASGQTYVGQWKQGQRDGWGKHFEASGFLTLDGNFQNDAFVKNRLESRGEAV